MGLDVAVGGGLEGVAIGAAAGLAFAVVTRRTEDGSWRPASRVAGRPLMAVCCGLAGLALTARRTSRSPAAPSRPSPTQRRAREPRWRRLGRLIGEPDLGPLSRAILGFGEPAAFGLGLAYGLMRRPRRGR